ncbi:helix-turn-helix domain-containing protein [Paenibacillus xylanexedens]|uniref:helix-turn-helix domain-containing protein n=1 Tax=Paenibacillus xylanexedens TaxID=528191 RepID=UPI00119CA1ED|nr:helix-turn-helix transcriptional regulator [Paenibacillus xylanexedens]
MPTLGERMKYLRELMGLSQKELSRLTDLTVVQLSRYETNHRKPDPDALGRLVNVLGTTADYLIGLTKSPFSDVSPDLDEHVHFYLQHPVHGAFFREYLHAPDQLQNETRQFFKFISEQLRTPNI